MKKNLVIDTFNLVEAITLYPVRGRNLMNEVAKYTKIANLYDCESANGNHDRQNDYEAAIAKVNLAFVTLNEDYRYYHGREIYLCERESCYRTELRMIASELSEMWNGVMRLHNLVDFQDVLNIA